MYGGAGILALSRDKCVLCGKEAVRSLATSRLAEAFGNLGNLKLPLKGRVGLCKEHYRLYKKKVKAERETSLARMKDLYS
ncbi:MAG: hypothetical protein DRJ98_07545 [Thermoprotei archaeon]|nr:MAG: hypothetical protein DRJ98_07545 [Thermoprotei archaeon]